jgi:hypothetical protein
MRLSRERSPLSSTTSINTRLAIETLEDRVVPSWGRVPPGMIAIPSAPVSDRHGTQQHDPLAVGV